MAHFSVRGESLQGNIYALNTNNSEAIQKAAEQSREDGLDQVFFEAEGKTYLLEGDGLDLSAFKRNVLPRAELNINGKQIPAQILYLDDEVNTASEGLRHVGTSIAGALLGPAAIGSTFLLKGSQGLASQSSALVAHSQTLGTAVAQVGHLNKLPIAIIEGMPSNIGKFNIPKGVTTQFKTSHSLVLDKGLKTVEAGVAQSKTVSAAASKTAAQAGQQVSKLHTGLKVIAIGVAVAGTVAIGGALYGAYRGSDESEALKALKGEAIHE